MVHRIVQFSFSKYFCILLFSIIHTILFSSDKNSLTLEQINQKIDQAYSQLDYKTCIKYLTLARTKARFELGRDSVYAMYTSDLGYMYKITGQFIMAEKLYLEALDIRKQKFGRIHPDYSICMNNLGRLYKAMGEYEKATYYYREAIYVREHLYGKDHPKYANAINNLAVLKKVLGHYQEAEKLNLEALRLRKMIYGKIHSEHAESLNNLAELNRALERFEVSEQYFIQAKEILEALPKPNYSLYASVKINLAVLYMSLKRYDEAERLLLSSNEIMYNHFGEYSIEYAKTINNIAKLYTQINNLEAAIPLYQKSLEIREQLFGPHHALCVHATNSLIKLYIKKGNYKLAKKYAKKALFQLSHQQLDLNINQNWHYTISLIKIPSITLKIELIKLLDNLYDLLGTNLISENKIKQKIITQTAISIYQNIMKSFISEQDKLRVMSKSYDWMIRQFELMDMENELLDAFQVAELHKSVLLMEATKSSTSHHLGNIPDSIYYQEKMLLKKKESLETMIGERMNSLNSDSLQSTLINVNLELNAFITHIHKQYPMYYNSRFNYKPATIQNIQSQLEDKSCLIEYVIGNSSVYIFYIDKHQYFLKKIQLDYFILKEKLEGLRYALSEIGYAPNKRLQLNNSLFKNAYWCYENLFKPIEKNLKDKSHVIIIPDNELVQIPFEALLSKDISNVETSQYNKLPYLLNRYSFSYNYSATLWLQNMQDRHKSNDLILGCAPFYRLSDSSAINKRNSINKQLRKSLAPLPSAKKEIMALANNFEGLFVVDSMATEATFKKNASQYGIIHLAMHSVFNEQNPMLTSLAFTENGDSTQNNLLYSYEISRHDFVANLVVLSACQTGFGKYEKGNGVASLGRAFMYAGVPSLVVSLWQVDDIATSNIMKEFYEYLANGLSKSEALRLAKLNYLNNVSGLQAHPAYWSPFIQIGNSEPIKIQRKYTYAPWYIGLVMMCLVAGLIFWNRRRIF